MNFKINSILFRTTVFFTVLIIIGISGYLLRNGIDKENKYYDLQSSLIEKNNNLAGEISYLSERILSGEENLKLLCNEKIALYELGLSILRSGGKHTDYYTKDEFKPAQTYMMEGILLCENSWKLYSEDVQKIIEEKLFVHVTIASDTVSEGKIIRKTSSKKVINPTIENAIKECRKTIEVVYGKNYELIETINAKKQENQRLKVWIEISIIVLIFTLVTVTYIFIYSNLFKKLDFLKKATNNIFSEDNKFEIPKRSDDEIQPIIDNIQDTATKIVDIAEFVYHLEKDNLDVRILEAGNKNSVGRALVKLRDKLKQSKIEENKRNEEETLRQWAVNGHSNFNDIMRRSSANLQTLVDELTKELVYFLKAAQGGLFLLVENKDDKYLELKTAFAFDRKKLYQKRVEIGAGLVGVCALEKNVIYIEEVPKGYLEIESGLGDARPACLLIFPLKTETELLGVIELASFKKFQKHEVDFVERLAETVASTLETAKISAHTGDLLEETKKKSDELAARDKEMRENIKELRDAQEQAKTKEKEMESILLAVNQVLLKAEISVGGSFMSINILYQELLGYHLEEIQNKLVQDVFDENTRKEFEHIWADVLKGETMQTTHKQYTKRGTPVWLLSQYTPVIDESGKIMHILYLGNDITNQKEIEDRNRFLIDDVEKNKIELRNINEKIINLENDFDKTNSENKTIKFELESLNSAIDNTVVKAIFNIRGTIIICNQKFLETWKTQKNDIINRNIRNFIPEDSLPVFEKVWSNLRKGTKYSGTEALLDATGGKIWLNLSFTPIESSEDNSIKVLLLANDITMRKEAEQKIEELSKELGEQEIQLEKTIASMMEKQNAFMSEFDKIQVPSIKNELEIIETDEDKIYREWLENIKNENRKE